MSSCYPYAAKRDAYLGDNRVHDDTNSPVSNWMDARVRWLEKRQAQGQSAYLKKHGVGHEIYNFVPSGKRIYGFVQYHGNLALGRIDPAGADADRLDHVTVIWCASHKRGGVYVVGWYRNATVHSAMQMVPNSPKRIAPNHPSKLRWWSVEAKASDARLLPEDARWMKVPRRYALRSYVRYLDDTSSHGLQFRERLLKYVAGGWKKHPKAASKGTGWQADVAKRLKIEKAAMMYVAKHDDLGFTVIPVPKENKGWDLEALRDSLYLRVEVKGCSGNAPAAELTPSEFAKAQAHRGSYRICFVTNALSSPKLHAFQWNFQDALWSDDSGNHLQIQKRTGARIWVL